MQSPYLYGIHDPGGEHLLKMDNTAKGWVLFTEALGANPKDHGHGDYRPYADQGLGVIVRLNHGYEPEGTIPNRLHYANFAQRCANFVAASPGCNIWIIGNETNVDWERPGGRQGPIITPQDYADCYRQCRDAILDLPGHEEDQVLVAAVAPWNVQTRYPGNESGDWIQYFTDILEAIGPANCGGVTLHTYTHGPDPFQIYSHCPMGHPFEHRQFNFLAYRDFMNALPDWAKRLPIYITETDQDEPWLDVNNGWVQRAYGEINWWNQQPANPKIRALILYRWPNYDKWGFCEKFSLHEDLRQALTHNYRWDTAPVKAEPATNLKPGQMARVAAGACNVRIAPGLNTSVIDLKRKGDVVTLHGEPRVVDGLTWWDIRPGWMAERSPYNVTLLEPYSPTPADDLIADLSAQYSVDPALIRAVIAIESGGSGFDANGRLLIRFEPHICHQLLDDGDRPYFRQHFEVGSTPWDGNGHRVNLGSGFRSFHGNQDLEWKGFKLATTINEHAAHQSISMGAPQIMGFHYALLGYPTPMAMKRDFATGEPAQLRAMFTLIANKGAILKLQERDLLGFATIYNGQGQAQHYARLLQDQLA